MNRLPAKFDLEKLRTAVHECIQKRIPRLPDPVMREMLAEHGIDGSALAA